MRRAAAALICAFVSMTGTAGAFDAHGSVRQVYATGLKPGARTVLLNASDRLVGRQRATRLGGVLYRGVKPGRGYVLEAGKRARVVRVVSGRSAPRSTKVYRQRIPAKGYGYLTTRDGTKLAYSVRPPLGGGSGPVPTVIEYAGYGYARPSSPQSGIALLANLMGFAVVDVNMRGTGCSGGAYDYFEPLQSLDGYDVIETVARQPWVAHHKVGMMGISYGGISQLFTAQTRPPSLAAIAPLSVIDQTQTTLYPGGILNTGFALNWAQERVDDAKPAGPTAGQAWAYQRIQAGDKTCKRNQVLHANAVDLIAKTRRNDHYEPAVADPLSPLTFVKKIDVPVYLACQFTDEQTGGHCPTLAAALTGTKRKWITFTNGTHIDSLAPETFNRWFDFLQIYVARRAPGASAAAYRGAASAIYPSAYGVSGVTFPPDPIQDAPTYAAAKKAFEALPPVRVLFDNGAGGTSPGLPVPGYERSFSRFPAPGTQGRRWFLRADGLLDGNAPTTAGEDGFTWNPAARAPTDFTGDTASGPNGLWSQTPPYAWAQPPAGSAASYVTEPLTQSITALGAGYVEAWIKSSAPNVDLQATISEVRPDGKETFVQSGWLRADERKLDAAKSTPLAPVLSLRARDVEPLPADQFVPVTIPLYYQGHAYRAGSRLRVTISAPGGDQPVWAFAETQPQGTAQITIARSADQPSQLVLPTVPGDVPTALPPCPGLRGEPCRDYPGGT